MNIKEYIKMFAKYPGSLDAVLCHFKQEDSELSNELKAEYNALKSDLENLSVKELIPELKGFFFSSEPDEILDAVKNIPQPFLLVLYPNANTSGKDVFSLNTEYECVFSVLHNFSERNKDKFEKVIIDALTERIGKTILSNLIYEDLDKCGYKVQLDESDIKKVYETSFGCVGWSYVVEFNKKGLQ